MSSRYLLLGILAVGLSVLGGVVYSVLGSFRSLEITNRELRSMIAANASGVAAEHLQEVALRSEGCHLDALVLVRTEKGDTIPLSKVMSDTTAAVFCYSAYQCGICIDQQFQLLKENLPASLNHVIIVSDFASPKDFAVFRDLYGNHPVYSRISPWKIPVEDLNMPFWMILNRSGMRTEKVFIPQKEHPELSIAFFDLLQRRKK